MQGHNTSSTSILVQWGDVPSADQNGIILSYTVGYTALPGGSEQTKVVNAPATDTTLTRLNEFTNYSITVLASTSKGGGNISEPIIVITDEDSKLAVMYACTYKDSNFPRSYNNSSSGVNLTPYGGFIFGGSCFNSKMEFKELFLRRKNDPRY